MVLHDNDVHVGILDRLDVLEHDKSVPVLGQERDVRLRVESTRVALARPRYANRKCSTSLLIAGCKPDAECIQVEQESRALGRGHRRRLFVA
jgi:hypothetical protein